MPGPARGADSPAHDFQARRIMAQKGAQKRPEAASVRSLPQIAGRSGTGGVLSFSTLNDVVDEWLNFGYCRVTDHVSNDIALTPEGDEALRAPNH